MLHLDHTVIVINRMAIQILVFQIVDLIREMIMLNIDNIEKITVQIK